MVVLPTPPLPVTTISRWSASSGITIHSKAAH
jgi:hypothetical protein